MKFLSKAGLVKFSLHLFFLLLTVLTLVRPIRFWDHCELFYISLASTYKMSHWHLWRVYLTPLNKHCESQGKCSYLPCSLHFCLAPMNVFLRKKEAVIFGIWSSFCRGVSLPFLWHSSFCLVWRQSNNEAA